MGKSPGDRPLCAYLDGLVDELRKLVPTALTSWDEEAVHKSRVATRRLKAGLDLLQPVLSDAHRRPFGKVLRRLRRRLGPLRDLDVMIGHLESIGKKHAVHAEAAGWLAERLGEEREAVRRRTGKRRAPGKVLASLGQWWALWEEVCEAHEAIDGLLGESLHAQLEEFSRRAGALGTAEAEDPHELRIAGKRLRYTLEMAVEQGHGLPGEVTRSFKKMQECLGDWHDHVVLSEAVMRVSLEALLPHHDSGLQRKLLKLAEYALRRAEGSLKGFSDLWGRDGAKIAEAVRMAFPLTSAVEEIVVASPAGLNGCAAIDVPAVERETESDDEATAEPGDQVSETETDRDRSDSPSTSPGERAPEGDERGA